MIFKNFLELYIEDMNHRLEPKTIDIKNHIFPYFKNKSINDFSPLDIRKQQNTIISNNNYSQAYLKKKTLNLSRFLFIN